MIIYGLLMCETKEGCNVKRFIPECPDSEISWLGCTVEEVMCGVRANITVGTDIIYFRFKPRWSSLILAAIK